MESAAAGAGVEDSIVNNVFSGISNVSNGIYVSASNPNTVVSGSVFNNLGTAVNLIGTSGWNVQANTYQSVTTLVANIGTNSVGVATP